MIDAITIITFTAIGFYEAILLIGAIRLFRKGQPNRIQKVFGAMLLFAFITSTPYLLGMIGDLFSDSILAILNTLNTALLCFLTLSAYVLMQERLKPRHYLICFGPMLPEILSILFLTPDDYWEYWAIDFLTFLYLFCAYMFALFRLKRWDKKILDEFSDIDHKQTLWYRHSGIFLCCSFLLWIPLYFFPEHTWIWLLYCLINSALCFIMTEYALQQEVVNITSMEEICTEPEIENQLWIDKLADLMEKEKIFCEPDLDLNTLSKEIGVNRTYLSKYLNQQLNTTFYEFVNEY